MTVFSPFLIRSTFRVLAAGVVLAVAGGAALAQQTTTPPGDRARRTVTVRVDSSNTKVTVVLEGLDSLMRSLVQSRALEERIGMALREYGAAQSNLARRHALEEQLQKLAESNVHLMSRIQMACTARRALDDGVPEGYLGVTFNIMGTVKREAGGAEVYRFEDPPEIISVETGSPADRAGVRRGDRVIALDGRDVTGRDVAFAQLLVPGRRLPMRIAREGREQNLVVVVQKRPDGFGDQCTDLDLAMLPVRPSAAHQPAPGGRTFTFVRPSAPRAPASTTPAPTPPDAPSPPSVWTFEAPPPVVMSGYSSIVAGAQLTTLTEDFRELTGADGGVLVQRVLPETPAAAAGLRGGDVIVEAGDRAVTSARLLQRMISDTDDRALRLKVVRKGKTRVVTLRW